MKALLSKRMAWAIWVCGLAALFYGYEDTLRVLPGTIAQYLLAEGHLNPRTLGLMSSFFYVGYAPMQVPVGFLLDRFGPRRCLLWATFVCGVATACFAVSGALWILCGSRFSIGVAASLAYIAASVLIARWLPAKRFVLALGLVQLVGCLGAMLGQWPVARLLEAWPWRPVVLVLGAICLLLTVLYGLFLRDSPRQRVISHHPQVKTLWHSLGQVLHQSQTWHLGAYIFFLWAPMSIFAVLWGIPFFHASYHMSNAEAAKLLSFVWIGVAIGGPLSGWCSNAVGSRSLLMIIGPVMGVMATTLMVYDVGLSHGALVWACLAMGMASSVQTVSFGAVFDRQPKHLLGTAVGFQNMCCVLGGFLLQPLVGVLLMAFDDANTGRAAIHQVGAFQHALWLLPLCYLLAGLLAWFAVQETHCRVLHPAASG